MCVRRFVYHTPPNIYFPRLHVPNACDHSAREGNKTRPRPFFNRFRTAVPFRGQTTHIQVVCPQNGTAVLKELTLIGPQSRFGDKLLII